ncbi:hypothetical protein JCM6882_005698 [Rhodosporidiobolus microsporus]
MSVPRLRTLLQPLRGLTAPHFFHPSSPPHLASPGSPRLFTTRAPVQASYRRFGDPPRGQRPPPEPRREEDEPIDPFKVLLSRLPQQRQGQQVPAYARDGGREYSYGHGGREYSYGRGGGFTLNNLKAYISSPIFVILVAAGGTYYLLHLEQVPETGRWRFIDVSPSMEQQMGAESYEEVMREYKGKILPDWHPQARYVQDVVKRIVRANGLEEKVAGGVKFVTHVVKEDGTRNAFVLPNGAIFVFTGILPVAQDADGLAVVLGHEIAHQVARHSAERMSGMKVFYGLAFLLASFGIDFGISRIFLQLVMSLPNSRKNETEADLIGLRLANAACYDPRAAEGLWQRMGSAEQTPGMDMSFLSTHPSSQNRTVKVREWAEEVVRDRPDECGPLREKVPAFQRVAGARW